MHVLDKEVRDTVIYIKCLYITDVYSTLKKDDIAAISVHVHFRSKRIDIVCVSPAKINEFVWSVFLVGHLKIGPKEIVIFAVFVQNANL